jgi:hypothetical protein
MFLPQKTQTFLFVKSVTLIRVIKKILIDIFRPKNTKSMIFNVFQWKLPQKPIMNALVEKRIRTTLDYGDIKKM